MSGKVSFVCNCLNGYFGSYCQSSVLNSTIHKNSTILTQENSLILVENITNTVFPSDTTYTLIYQATRNGFSTSNFHAKCDGILNTLIIVKTSESYVFGGFTTQDWSIDKNEESSFQSDSNAFLFSLVNPFGVASKMRIDVSDVAIRSDETSINFGYEIAINDNSEKVLSYAWMDSLTSYRLPYFLNGTGSLLVGGKTSFFAHEIEAYSLNINRM